MTITHIIKVFGENGAWCTTASRHSLHMRKYREHSVFLVKSFIRNDFRGFFPQAPCLGDFWDCRVIWKHFDE